MAVWKSSLSSIVEEGAAVDEDAVVELMHVFLLGLGLNGFDTDTAADADVVLDIGDGTCIGLGANAFVKLRTASAEMAMESFIVKVVVV
mmetsp:Transcript_13833/g.21011  ORF Transcript_13833/g.21011 Transcript_13833/m.21011 type:complete len:89 (+) Transcript_13833:1313-1579(+)